jgi:putative ABC transport system permease protein
MDEQLDRLLFRERLIAALAIGFATLAIVLACVGLYGVVAYVTSGRTREIGVRMALGASRSGVLGSIFADTMRLATVGIFAGICLSVVVNRAIAGLLFGVATTDPVTFAASSAVFVVVSAVAGLLPALRAARVNPVIALRSE